MTSTVLYEIDISDKPQKLKGGIAAKFRIFELSFVALAKTIEDASRASGYRTSTSEFTRAQREARRKAQVRAYDAGGTEVPIDDGELLKLPRSLFSKITAGLDRKSKAPAGKVIAKGDGADTPVIFKLGTGLAIAGDKGEQVIHDLEFQAKTGAEIEDVLVENYNIAQTIALIEHCATPLAKDLGLLRLPSWALDQITLADGMEIMDQVLPGFLE